MKQLPEKIALDKAVHGQRLYQGSVELEHMSRLSDMLAGNDSRSDTKSDSRAEFSIQFDRARGLLGKAQIKVSTELPLICVISQKMFRFPVAIESCVGFIDDLAYEDLLDENMEASWVNNGFVKPLELIEDELILAVPDSPFNQGHNNDADVEEEEMVIFDKRPVEKRPNPFDVLKNIK